jgi:hypothetical protein
MITTVKPWRKKGLARKLLGSMVQGLPNSPTLALPTPLDWIL